MQKLLLVLMLSTLLQAQNFGTPISLSDADEIRVGEVLAQETARLIHTQGQVIVVTMDTSKAPELKAQMGVFERTLKKLGPITIKELPVDTEDKPQYRTGAGLSSRRFLRILYGGFHWVLKRPSDWSIERESGKWSKV